MIVEKKIERINILKSQAESLISRKGWDRDFLEQLKIDFTHVSNKIEGNAFEYGQTVRLLRDLVVPQHASPGDTLDIIHHKEVLDIVFQNFHGLSISEESIKRMHAALMKDHFQWSDDGLFSPGQYKSFDNFTYRKSGKEHRYLSAADVPEQMNLLIEEVNERLKRIDFNDKKFHPIGISTFFHQRFLNDIHPFSDGNGRVGRLFANIILIKCSFPPIFIEEIDRNRYFEIFELAESEPDVMLDFMADRLLESLDYELRRHRRSN
jgi:Fic family protein